MYSRWRLGSTHAKSPLIFHPFIRWLFQEIWRLLVSNLMRCISRSLYLMQNIRSHESTISRGMLIMCSIINKIFLSLLFDIKKDRATFFSLNKYMKNVMQIFIIICCETLYFFHSHSSTVWVFNEIRAFEFSVSFFCTSLSTLF